MIVKLLHATPLEVADIAICKCYSNKPHDELEKIQARITKVANVSKHSSTIEHLNYSFDIDGISRAVLQELARHRIASYTVKSTRYTLQELKNEAMLYTLNPYNVLNNDLSKDYELKYVKKSLINASKYIVLIGNIEVDVMSLMALEHLRKLLVDGLPNDKAKYCLPEAYKTSLVMTINARSLQNFLELRTSKHALKEIQDLARAIFEVLPSDHKFLFRSLLNDV